MFKRTSRESALRKTLPYVLAIFVAGMGMQSAYSQDAQALKVDIDSSHMTGKANEALHYRCGAPRNDAPYEVEVQSPVDVAQGLGKFAVNVTKEGAWIPRHANFTYQDSSVRDHHFDNQHLISTIVAIADSTYDVDLTQAGVITATETGSTNKLTNLKFAHPPTGTVTWRATETVDLHTGADSWSFHADMDATYKTSNFSPSCNLSGTLDAAATSTRVIKLPPQLSKR